MGQSLSRFGLGPRSRTGRESVKAECLACADSIAVEEMVCLSTCKHYMCHPCLRRGFSLVRNEADWPIRCCATISLQEAAPALTPSMRRDLERRIEEYETPARSRVYCSKIRCGNFISPRHIQNRTADCQSCRTKTCTLCKERAHNGLCGPPDGSAQQALVLSEERRWRRCSECGHMLERNGGCLHMTCLCGHEFCYSCGEPGPICFRCPLLAPTPRYGTQDVGMRGFDAMREFRMREFRRRQFDVPQFRGPTGAEQQWLRNIIDAGRRQTEREGLETVGPIEVTGSLRGRSPWLRGPATDGYIDMTTGGKIMLKAREWNRDGRVRERYREVTRRS